jgi:hypothetical protein
MRRAAAGLALVVLAGCTPAITDELYMPTVEEDLTTCGADKLQGLVGQPRAAIEAMRFSRPVVLVDPDSSPADHDPGRLSIEFLEFDRVTRVACG